ncbi:MAG TPA: Crp/Fnr family transcriptional regulator [Vicinamibacterales bacterium]|nr:Crp/Fnr family transcriptional regulator [Vicinamibacterales bacterium]
MTSNDRFRNRVLQHLARTSPAVHAQLVAQLEPIFLERGVVLGIARKRTESVYFLESGIVSLIASTRSGDSLEVAIVGREGVAGIADALGQRPLPYGWVVQLSGIAYRAPTDVVRDHILSCTALHEVLMAYSQLMMHQLAQSAVCNRFHTSEQRLSRWLLLTAERAGTMRFELTHEFVAQMVGAPRSAVSQAAAVLRRKGLIDYRRGVMTIRNVKRLRKASCECFDAVSIGGDTQPGHSEVTVPGDTQL